MAATAFNYVVLLALAAGFTFGAPFIKRDIIEPPTTPENHGRGRRGVKGLNDASQYLEKYGYFGQPKRENSLSASDEVEEAIKIFQKTFGKTVTGKLDEETLSLMNSPRCSLPDIVTKVNSSRQKRFNLYERWRSNSLTYSLDNYPKMTIGFPRQSDVDLAVDDSFEIWNRYADVSFSRVSASYSYADLQVGFYSRDHGDEDPFDGPGGVLAHAFFPEDGRIHMDDADTWTQRGNSLYDQYSLRLVLAHEIGHALGLRHSFDGDALMYPYYEERDFDLGYDDVLGIQALYGSNRDLSRTTSKITSAKLTVRPRTSATTTQPRSPATATRPKTSAPTTRSSLDCKWSWFYRGLCSVFKWEYFCNIYCP